MAKFKLFIYAFIMLFSFSLVNAAVIYGSIYDLSLKRVNNARVEINTSPKQFHVAQNGSYSFNVPNGAHTIKAQLMQKNTAVASVQENITIKQDGSYVLDLILFPDIEEGVEAIEIGLNEDIIESEKKKNDLPILIIILIILIILIIIFIGAYYFKKTKKQKKELARESGKTEEKSEGDDLSQIIEIIKQESGRTTQKEIRKQIPMSEAKISLMIAELEHKNIIEKIKKGRGNIIILKKK